MIAVNFDGSNKVLGAPAGMEDSVHALHVYNDGEVSISCWELTDNDKEILDKLGKIYLTVVAGFTQPPVALSVENPFVESYRSEKSQEIIDNVISDSEKIGVYVLTNRVTTILVDDDEFDYIAASVVKAKGADRDDIKNTFDTMYLSTLDKGVVCFQKKLL